jgi:cytochrome P450 / NADPH-cytochrome P450 reductase
LPIATRFARVSEIIDQELDEIMTRPDLVDIPQPPTKPLLGNLLDLDRIAPVQGLVKLAHEYGPIYRLAMRGTYLVVVSGHQLVAELCDETRFDKSVSGALRKVRKFTGDGLFTANTSEPNWSKAHKILLPNFSQRAMHSYHSMMLDIAGQLISKWTRLNADDEIDVAHDMTSLTLDTIGLCGFDYRFNSFYRDGNHPFVDAMVDSLSCAMEQVRRLPGEDLIRIARDRRYADNVNYMNVMADRIIKERREAGDDITTKPDLLSYMLAGVDKKSGERLDDLNIRYQMITFLIAGHETTSGLLSFTINALLNDPEVLNSAYEEVDRVLGAEPDVTPSYAQVSQLEYISQILKESLRLWPTAPGFSLYPFEDTVIGGKYEIKKQYQVLVLLPALHRDKSIWGTNPELFNPDNFTALAERARPASAYKPFGNGQRACNGRQFALHEATLVLGMVLHRFKLIDRQRYKLKIKETLTLKPDGLTIRVRLRRRQEQRAPDSTNPSGLSSSKTAASGNETQANPAPAAIARHETPLLVLFGSNLGTAEELAQRIAQDGKANGFAATIAPLDDYARKLPQSGAVAIVSASYNGTPPDNAVHFCDWLDDEGVAENALTGVSYSVFGCGNRDWAGTFQAIPRLIDEKLAAHGAHRLMPRGEGDARGDFDGQFVSWYRPFWKTLAENLGIDLDANAAVKKKSLYEVEIVSGDGMSPLAHIITARPMRIAANRELHTKDGPRPSERSTHHLEVILPEGVTYRAGDHSGVLPCNGDESVRRVAKRFGFDKDVTLRLHKRTDRKTILPVDEPISLFALLRDYPELQSVATRSQIETMAAYTQCPPERSKLLDLIDESDTGVGHYRDEVMARRKSVIDLLEECPACALPLGIYLEMLQPLTPRYYSISSSPLVDPHRCSITVAIVNESARSGHGTFRGVCSNYLLGQLEDDIIPGFVKDNHSAFHLPNDPLVPIIMVGPGTGVAPFRGFIQERAQIKASGKAIGPSILFFGCRHPQQDFIYADEMSAFENAGITELHVAFSRSAEEKKVYVQDQIIEHKDRLWELFEAGAITYVCGDASQMAPGVRQAFAAIYAEKKDTSLEIAIAWMDQMTREGRYLVDVWSGG